MGKFIFPAVVVLVIVGAIFVVGVIVGLGFATSAAEAGVQKRIEECLPVETGEELETCLAPTDETP